MTLFPVSILRTVALAAQGLHQPLGAAAPPDREGLLQAIRQVGGVQIDTLQVVRRSQYVVLWSRLGSYNPEDLDNLQKGEGRMLFEGWQHAACLIPLEE